MLNISPEDAAKVRERTPGNHTRADQPAEKDGDPAE